MQRNWETCDLDVDIEDVEVLKIHCVAEEAQRPFPTRVAVARCGASVWAPLPPQIPTRPAANRGRRSKRKTAACPGVLRVDTAQPEIDAIETRLRELRKK